jgi:hypothetical protein
MDATYCKAAAMEGFIVAVHTSVKGRVVPARKRIAYFVAIEIHHTTAFGQKLQLTWMILNCKR